jgi:hypothetical protein
MVMTGPTLALKIFGAFTASGFIGIDSINLANAIGNGSMLEILGKPFETMDGPGSGSAAGAGVGVGLVGIVGALVSTQIQSELVLITGLPPTPDMISMCDAIGDSLEMEVALATLITQHTPMWSGVAQIKVGSIGVVSPSVGSSIKSAAPTFIGKDWPDFANAYGTGIGDSFALATSNPITVAGSPPGTPDPIPAPKPNAIAPAGVLL